MKRMLLLVLATAVLVAACDCDEDAVGESATAAANEPAPPPEDLRWVATIGDADELLGRIADELPVRARAVLPRSPGDLVEGLTDAPIGDRIVSDAPLYALAVGAQGEKIAVAARVRIDDGENPLGAGTLALEGGPHGSRLVRASRDGSATALVDDVIVTAPDADTLEEVIPYVVRTLMVEEPPEGVRLRTTSQMIPTLRGWLDDAIGERAGALRSAAERERGRHEEAPDLGEPEAVVDAVERRLRELVAYVPDLESVEISIVPHDDGFDVRVEGPLTQGSPLARVLAESAPTSTSTLRRLPASTIAGWSSAASTDERPWLDVVAQVAGERLSEDERRTFALAEESLAASPGSKAVWVVALDGSRPYVSRVIGRTAGEPDLAALRSAATSAYATTVSETVLGCGLRAGVGDTLAECEADGATAALSLHRDGATVALTLGPSERAGSEALATLAVAGGGRRLGDDPDAARTLSRLGEEALATGVVSPRGAIALPALLAAPPGARAPGRSGLVAFTVRRDDDRLVVEIALGPGAVAEILSLVVPLLE